jgi:catechol 2,3-dioxygenase-like lactoylglutathione lyase family enzyme
MLSCGFAMSFAHLTLPSQHVEETTRFFEDTFGYRRLPVPSNIPVETQWLDVGLGQTFHVFFVDGFTVSPFEREFGRHVAVFHPLDDFAALKDRLARRGVEFVDQVRLAPFERFFFREPINGYFFEVIDNRQARHGQP